jgi:hypothetical protein
MREFGLSVDDDVFRLDDLDPEDIEELVGWIFTWLSRAAPGKMAHRRPPAWPLRSWPTPQ